jgi:isopenicillin-N epimerase
MNKTLKSSYMLDPEWIFLNHGSFGACPVPVFEKFQYYQRELERQPVQFIGRRLGDLLSSARQRMADYIHAPVENVVFFTNVTTALNMAIRSLVLEPGDEVLTTDHEYPALDSTWNFVAHRTQARYIHQPIPVPVHTKEEIIEALFAGVTPRTKILFISHLTCFSTLIMPIEEICQRARALGLITIVDGAHALSQIPLDMGKIGADIYVGACHKWLSAPKGSAFLYASPAAQEWLDPLVISWGWQRKDDQGKSMFAPHHQNQGTRDVSAFLSVPTAIDFQQEHDWPAQQARCYTLAKETRQRINALTKLDSLSPDSPDWFRQLLSIRLPEEVDLGKLSRELLEEEHIELPILKWNGLSLLRVSFQAYNSQEDADALVRALEKRLFSS